MDDKTFIRGYCAFLGFTGYANHSRNFFTELNKSVPVRVTNCVSGDEKILTNEQLEMLKGSDPVNKKAINIILETTNHFTFYDDKITYPKIAYNVWESTRQPEHFFKKLLEYDQLWVPTKWQADCSIEQGFPASRVKIVPEGVDGNMFKPLEPGETIPAIFENKFTFVVFGRWEYRKSTKEIVECFLKAFPNNNDVQLFLAVDNPFPVDEYKSTEERLYGYGLEDRRIIVQHFIPTLKEYSMYLRSANVFLSCSRSEGWNLPLIEALASGVPSISSNCSGQLEFADDGMAHMVSIKYEKPPQNVYAQDNVPGMWYEPDFDHLTATMVDMYKNYKTYKQDALENSVLIRDKFSWKNAANIAMEHIEELYQLYYGTIKLNMGCGETKLPGFLNVDNYVDNADIKADVSDMSGVVEDNYADEVYSSHCLEHFGKHEVLKVLLEWKRVLKPGGLLILNIPDLEWCLKNWLSKPEDKRWGWELDTIFGNQNHGGEFHKTGFTRDRITYVLSALGFENIETKYHDSHAQQSILVNATKPEVKMNKEYTTPITVASTKQDIFVIGAYCNTAEKHSQLIETIERVRAFTNMPIMIVSHYPVGREIQEMVEYVIYDKENILSDTWKMPYYYNVVDEVLIETRWDNANYHAVACLTSIKNALEFTKNNYNYMYFCEYDVGFDVEKFIIAGIESRTQDKKFLGFNYENLGIVTNIMAGDISWMDENIPRYHDWKEYEKEGLETSKYLSRPPQMILEFWLRNYFDARELMNQTTIINKPREIIYEKNKFDQVDWLPKFRMADTTENKSILFLINDSKDLIRCTIMQNDTAIETNLKPGAEWYIFDKDNSVITVEGGGRKNVFNLNDKHIETAFTFKTGEYAKHKSVAIALRETIDSITKIGGAKNIIEAVSGSSGSDRLITPMGTNVSNIRDYIPKTPSKVFNCHFVGGAFLEIKGTDDGSEFKVEFTDQKSNRVVHSTKIKAENWTKPNAKYFVDWLVRVTVDEKEVFIHKLDLKDKRIMISFDSKSLGDTLAWIPIVEEFRKKHECKILLSTFKNDMLVDVYPEIEFIKPGTVCNNLYASYNVGCYDNEEHKHISNWRVLPLQKVACEILGIDYKEYIPNVKTNSGYTTSITGKYVTISDKSTMQSKFWNYEGGWQQIVDYLIDLGYSVVSISSEPCDLKGIINCNGLDIDLTIANMLGSDFHLGLGSGPSWLAWALRKPVVMISGFSLPYCEFKTDNYRVFNESVCNGCFNDPSVKFDRSWDWCPRNRGYECTKAITPDMVKEQIDRLIKEKNLTTKSI